MDLRRAHALGVLTAAGGRRRRPAAAVVTRDAGDAAQAEADRACVRDDGAGRVVARLGRVCGAVRGDTGVPAHDTWAKNTEV